ncbi:MAG: tol-pal system protein YbgF [Pseudomonadota bacterium]
MECRRSPSSGHEKGRFKPINLLKKINAMKVIVLFLAALVCIFGCAIRQDVVTLDDNMSILERRVAKAETENAFLKKQMEILTKTGDGKDQDLRNRTAENRVAVDRLSEEIQAIRGKFEETEFLIKKRLEPFESPQKGKEDKVVQLEKALLDLEKRFARIEGYLNMESQTPGSQAGPAQPAKKTDPGQSLSDNEIYAKGKEAFDRGDFPAARNLFQDLIKNHPASVHADNAQFWIGESFYREKWYEKAILEYQKVIEKYPKGNKVQSSMLKQGFAFHNLGDKTNARLILKELVRLYPTSNEANIAKEKLKEYQ